MPDVESSSALEARAAGDFQPRAPVGSISTSLETGVQLEQLQTRIEVDIHRPTQVRDHVFRPE
ncbi:hypothetical protein N803_09210 [Knoellia subterranea KCTC 19937]|uniref:Uncharacterized protein n=1 Tax=Knoellia subterranea KCTC 19937 TaxID=1385521 RepID=A0A0A0JGS6_9MICO|nr:hypothetical protein N803_09210 [Knoellia subterranea KCTC 19937]